ncbi:Uncharacterised protein [Mycobacterium tuberculosis]|nr:Uncharacterised protein [Mycobacterium tuberculosis]CKU35198.1 Uncharacterised protein [Mycobacterium tuberculosis]CNL88123.1 Uncharacterised protein [Mycobacterium tuberculosis]CNM01674.1 Uncharacterised protein [Mycobacterium tuberculosis]CNM08011.1 Uncharacterised protein [Mycobacterium tuberculosis]
MRRQQAGVRQRHLTFLLGQRGHLGDRRRDLRSQAGHLGQVDAQATTDTGLGQRRNPTQPAPGSTEEPTDSVGPAQIQMRVVLPGAADTTEHLDTVLGVGFGGVDADARGHRRGDRKLGAIGIGCGAGRIGGGHIGLLGTAQHLSTQVLDSLEAADRLAELLPHLGVGNRGIERPSSHPGRLGRQHGSGQVFHPLPRHLQNGDRCRCQHHPGQRQRKVGGPQRLHYDLVASSVHQQPIPVGRQQHDAAGRATKHSADGARRGRRLRVDLHATVDSHPGEPFTRR